MGIGFLVPYLTLTLRPKLLPSLDETIIWAIYLLALIFGGLLALAVWTLRTSVTLIVGDPPIVETTRTWFWRLSTSKRLPLERAAWSRVVYADDMLLAIEIGTHGHQTTTVMCVPYSEANISIAENLCKRVATALHLENKGYHHHA